MVDRRWTDEQFLEAVDGAVSVSAILRTLGLGATGGNFVAVRNAATRLGVHLPNGRTSAGWRRATRRPNRVPNDELFVRDGTASTATVKARILAEGLIENRCALCGLGPEWRGRPLVLRLDHVNGDNRDHRLENLRLVCPNCDSQLDTFCGRNQAPVYGPRAQRRRPRVPCPGCDGLKSATAALCRPCTARRSRIDWPPHDELAAMVAASSKEAVGRRLGVSGQAVRKRLLKPR